MDREIGALHDKIKALISDAENQPSAVGGGHAPHSCDDAGQIRMTDAIMSCAVKAQPVFGITD
jgi:hypothetical protein